MSVPRLAVSDVAKAYGATRALSSVSLSAEAGELHAILGENGAGKSTLMKVLAGVEQPDAGTVLLDGRPFRPASPAEARAAGVALVSQELSLCPHLSVADNVVLGDEPSRWGFLDGKRRLREVTAALAETSNGRISPHARAGDLSLADQQLVEIARALRPREGKRCSVLILDEPTSSLGHEDAARLFALVRRLASPEGGGTTVLYISHFLEEVRRLCQRFTVLRDGQSVETGALVDTDQDQLITHMSGRPAEQLRERAPRAPGEPVLTLSSLAGREKPIDASLTLRRGEVLGLAGLIGAGRTELLRAVFGLDVIRRGEVRLKGFSGSASPARRWAQGAGMLSEDRQGEGLATSMSIADNLTLSRLDFGGLAGRLGLVAPAAQQAAARALIAELGVKCRGPEQRVSELSGGNQQKVAFARLLHHQVDVLLLDEPTRGIDVGSKQSIYSLIERLAGEGCAVLLVSSYLPELLGACDRIAVMCRGRLGPARDASAWTEHALLEAALGVGAAVDAVADGGAAA